MNRLMQIFKLFIPLVALLIAFLAFTNCTNSFQANNIKSKPSLIDPLLLTDQEIELPEFDAIRMDETYYKFNQTVYYKDKEMLSADLLTIKKILKGNLARDKNNVYCKDQVLQGSDLNSISLDSVDIYAIDLDFPSYAKDANHIYYLPDCSHVVGADPGSFRIFKQETNVFADKNSIYINGQKIENIDLNTFEILGSKYAKDKNNVYYDGQKLQDISPASFQVLKAPYSKDHLKVIHKGTILYDADVNTFVAHNSRYAQDKNKAYNSGKSIFNVELNTFKVVNENYAKDVRVIYALDRKITVGDPETFSCTSSLNCEDSKNLYFIRNGEATVSIKFNR